MSAGTHPCSAGSLQTTMIRAPATIRAGKRFTYQDAITGERRVGYYDRRHERLTALDGMEGIILTHFHCPERYVRALPASDYRR